MVTDILWLTELINGLLSQIIFRCESGGGSGSCVIAPFKLLGWGWQYPRHKKGGKIPEILVSPSGIVPSLRNYAYYSLPTFKMVSYDLVHLISSLIQGQGGGHVHPPPPKNILGISGFSRDYI